MESAWLHVKVETCLPPCLLMGVQRYRGTQNKCQTEAFIDFVHPAAEANSIIEFHHTRHMCLSSIRRLWYFYQCATYRTTRVGYTATGSGGLYGLSSTVTDLMLRLHRGQSISKDKSWSVNWFETVDWGVSDDTWYRLLAFSREVVLR